MDLEDNKKGGASFTLGPVEKLVVAGCMTLAVSVGSWFVLSINKQAETLQKVVTQQAVTNNQLAGIALQLADIPALRAQVAEIKVRVERLEADARDERDNHRDRP